jgi:hypothetical protein
MGLQINLKEGPKGPCSLMGLNINVKEIIKGPGNIMGLHINQFERGFRGP